MIVAWRTRTLSRRDFATLPECGYRRASREFARRLSDTKTEREIAAVAERGGVIGGSSAGAMIQGSFLINVTKSPGGMRISRTGMYLDTAKLVGFGILKNVTIYPHLGAEKRKEMFLK